MKQVCVLGLGQFGSHLARELAEMDCDVLAVDQDEIAVNLIRDRVQRAVITDVRNMEALKSIIPAKLDEAVVSLGESMEASILCTLHLAQLGVKRIRAKAATGDHAAILKAVGAHEVIFPERETAERIAQRIVHPDLLDFLPLSKEYRVVEVKMPESFAGNTLIQLQLRQKYGVLALAVKNPATDEMNFMPDPDHELASGSTLVLMGTEAEIAKLADAE
jgi:trk system potassium uptake protein TrkA